MNFDNDSPLNMIPRETQKAHKALMDYVLMGVDRSLEKLYQIYTKSTLSVPTLHIATLKKWSSRHQWQARIARQSEIDHAIVLAQIENAQAEALALWSEQHMSEAEALAEVAKIARGDMGAFSKIRTQADLENHPDSALVKNVTQHYTHTTRGSGDNKESEIKGRIILGLYDRLKALEYILRNHGSFVDIKEVTGKDGAPLSVKVIKGVSMDDL